MIDCIVCSGQRKARDLFLSGMYCMYEISWMIISTDLFYTSHAIQHEHCLCVLLVSHYERWMVACCLMRYSRHCGSQLVWL